MNNPTTLKLEHLADELDRLDENAAFLDDSAAKTNLATGQLVLQVAALRTAIRQVRIHVEQARNAYFTDNPTTS